MQKMLYLCPVDWRWIKQRPQFLAENLAKHYSVYAVYPFMNKRKCLQKKHKTNVKLFPLFSFPTLNGRLPCVSEVNALLSKLQFMLIIHAIKPDILWLSMPWQLTLLPQRINCKIIYDCMDDYAAITPNPAKRSTLIQQENQLLARADIIFASSGHLQNMLQNRCNNKQPVWLLRNGCDAKWISTFQEEPSAAECQEKNLKIGYIGTIGRWFDFPLLLNSLALDGEIEYHLYGPTENGITIPKHDRIIYHGVVEHDQLYYHAKEMHALIMPFTVNEIVQSVDPVKLYEYILMNKPIISVYYPEIERFKDYVLFYSTLEELLKTIDQVRMEPSPSYSRHHGYAFLKENTWDARAIEANNIIKDTIEK